MRDELTVIGVDDRPLPPPAAAALASATLVAGGRRHLDALPVPAAARTLFLGDVRAAVDALDRHDGPAVVLASGDPGFFGIVRRLQSLGRPLAVHAGASSVARVAARVGVPWDGLAVVSAHGRDPRPALAVVRSGVPVAVLTDARTGPRQVAAAARPGDRVVVGELLGAPGERITDATAGELAAAERGAWGEPNVVLVLPAGICPEPDDHQAGQAGAVWRAGAGPDAGAWALPDDAFAHRNGMITKAEVRAWVLARLGPAPGVQVWDVGTGSGSVAVECARLGAAVAACDTDAAQCERAQANAERHGVRVDVVHGSAPAVLATLPPPDAVLVGGGGQDVVAAVVDPAGPAVRDAVRPRRVVVPLAALDRVAPVLAMLRGAGYRADGVQLSAARLADLPGGSVRLAATNPVVVVTGELT